MNIEAFTNRAQAYAEARPGYPVETVDYICGLVPPNAVFADIGAGTGKFTEMIARRGYEVFAVEPNADMREQLTITLSPFPNAKIVDGAAEVMNLPDNSVDVITNAQALRRFGLDKFRAECLRIGKPNILVITVFNDGDKVYADYRPADKISAGYEQVTGLFYRNPDIRKFPNPFYFTRDKWIIYNSSMEGVPLEGDKGYEAYNAELNEIFDRSNADGVVCLNQMTYVFSEQIT